MIVEFKQEYLRELYQEEGQMTDRYGFRPDVVTGYKKCIDILLSAERIEDIFPFRSLGYKVLGGDKKGISTMRINSRYNVEFLVNKVEKEKTVITVCFISEEISRHKMK